MHAVSVTFMFGFRRKISDAAIAVQLHVQLQANRVIAAAAKTMIGFIRSFHNITLRIFFVLSLLYYTWQALLCI